MSDKKHQGDNHAGSGRSAPYGLSRLAPEMTLVDVAQEIAQADRAIGQATSGKLRRRACRAQWIEGTLTQRALEVDRD